MVDTEHLEAVVLLVILVLLVLLVLVVLMVLLVLLVLLVLVLLVLIEQLCQELPLVLGQTKPLLVAWIWNKLMLPRLELLVLLVVHSRCCISLLPQAP